MKQEFKRSFSRHNSTVLKHVPVDDERSKVEYKIEVKFILVQQIKLLKYEFRKYKMFKNFKRS